MDTNIIEKLNSYLKIVNGSLSKEDFEKAFKSVLDLVLKMEKRNSAEFDVLKQTTLKLIETMENRHNTAYSDLKGQVNDVFVGDQVKRMRGEHDERMKIIDMKVASLKDGTKGDKGDKGDRGLPGLPAPADNAGKIRDKLEMLKGDDRLDASAIRGIDKLIKTEKVVVRGGGGPNANAVQTHYFTGDGTKSYYVPTHRSALLLIGTQGPIMFKKTTDWTASNHTLTFTSAVDDVAGQEYVFLFVK